MAEPITNPLRYSIAQATILLGLSRSTLYTRVAEGKLTIHKDGRRTFVSAIQLHRYLRQQSKSDSSRV